MKATQNHTPTKAFITLAFFRHAIKYFLTCCFISVTTISFSQQDIIDSLENVLLHAKEDTNKVNILNELSLNFRWDNEEKERVYAEQALALSEKLDFKVGIEKSYRNIGFSYWGEAGGTPKALDLFFKALSVGETIKDNNGICSTLGIIANIYANINDYTKALEYYNRSLKIREQLGDKNEIFQSFKTIGHIYSRQGKFAKENNNNSDAIIMFSKAMEYMFKALKISEEIGDKKKMADIFLGIGYTYEDQGKYEKALDFVLKSLSIYKDEITADCYWIYAEIGDLYKSQGDSTLEKKAKTDYYNKALEYYLKEIEILAKEKENSQNKADTYLSIGNVYFKLKEYNSALSYYNKCLEENRIIRWHSIYLDVYEALSIFYEKTGNSKSALEYYKLYKAVGDSIIQGRKEKEVLNNLKNYEFEKKEAEAKAEQEKKDAVEAEKSKKQKIIIWSVVGGLVMVVVVLLVVFRSLRIMRKQKHIIEIQKDEVTRQRDIVEEQKIVVEAQNDEIAHKNKDLTDSINYAQRIQSAILTSEQYLNDMFLPQGQVSSHFILYKPKDIVAGDFYWAYKTSDEKAIWVAADCTGHGVPGAFMSMIGNSLLNEIVVEKGIHEPDEILNNMRAGVIKALGQSGGDKKNDGMDAAMCCWDKINNRISFSGANNSLWIIRNGEFIEIPPDSQPVGQHLVMNPFTKREFQLQQGDTLYTFTDGYCDQFGGQKGKKFKYKPFRELLISIQDKSMPEQKEILNDTIEKWKVELEQIDDICVFGVRV